MGNGLSCRAFKLGKTDPPTGLELLLVARLRSMRVAQSGRDTGHRFKCVTAYRLHINQI